MLSLEVVLFRLALLFLTISAVITLLGFIDHYDALDHGDDDVLLELELEEPALKSIKVFMIAYLGKPFALLSMICSYALLRETLSTTTSRKNPLNRMLGSVAVSAFILAFGSFLGTWPSPDDVSFDITGNMGNQQFCTFQGFLIQLGWMSSVLGTTFLSLYCLWVVRYNFSDGDLADMERYMLPFVWVFSLAAAGYLVPMELYNNSNGVCHIQSVPTDCPRDECVRGSNPAPHLIFTSLITRLGVVVSVYVAVVSRFKLREMKSKENKYDDDDGIVKESPTDSLSSNETETDIDLNDSFSNELDFADEVEDVFAGGQSEVVSSMGDAVIRRLGLHRKEDPKKIQAVARKAIYYATAFVATFSFSFISQAVTVMFDSDNATLYFLGFLVFLPSGGTFNFFLFAKDGKMQTSEGKWLRDHLFGNPCSRGRKQEAAPEVPNPPAPSPQGSDNLVVFESDKEGRKSSLFEDGILSVFSAKRRPSNSEDSVCPNAFVETEDAFVI